MIIQPQYMTYNDVTVKFITTDANNNVSEYVVSNINTKGLPTDPCECHLASVSIKLPDIGGNANPSNFGTTGQITVYDYHDTIFKLLSNHLASYIDDSGVVSESNKQNKNLYPVVEIDIRCYTGNLYWQGYISDWKFAFTGETPSIQLEWMSICPIQNISLDEPKLIQIQWDNEGLTNFYDTIINRYKDSDIDIALADDPACIGKDAVTRLSVREYDNLPPHGIIYDPSTASRSSTDQRINAFQFICDNTTLDGYYIFGYIDNESKKFLIKQKPNQASFNKKSVSGIMFMFNGNYKPYERMVYNENEYMVIPMASFNFEMDFSKCAFRTVVSSGNINGTSTINANGVVTKQTGDTSMSVSDANSNALNKDNDPISITFDCYNCSIFSVNDLSSAVEFLIYNEYGAKHSASGYGMIREVNYEMAGAVIKAQVKCTKVFNSLINYEDNNENKSMMSTITNATSTTNETKSTSTVEQITPTVKQNNELYPDRTYTKDYFTKHINQAESDGSLRIDVVAKVLKNIGLTIEGTAAVIGNLMCENWRDKYVWDENGKITKIGKTEYKVESPKSIGIAQWLGQRKLSLIYRVKKIAGITKTLTSDEAQEYFTTQIQAEFIADELLSPKSTIVEDPAAYKYFNKIEFPQGYNIRPSAHNSGLPNLLTTSHDVDKCTWQVSVVYETQSVIFDPVERHSPPEKYKSKEKCRYNPRSPNEKNPTEYRLDFYKRLTAAKAALEYLSTKWNTYGKKQ